VLDRKGNDLGHFIRVEFLDSLHQVWKTIFRRLDDHQMLGFMLHLSFPLVNRSDVRDNVNAGSKLLNHKIMRDLLGGFLAVDGGKHNKNFSHLSVTS